MRTLELLCACLTVIWVIKAQEKSTDIVVEYCEKTLLQSKKVASNCYDTPKSYSKKDGNDAALIYLCCVGYFGDVTHDYMPYLGYEMVEFISNQTNNKQILPIATFIITCKQPDYKLVKADFLFWVDNKKDPKDQTACRGN